MNKAIKLLCISLAAVGLISCAEKPEGETLRPEYISVYEIDPSKTVSDIQIPFEGVNGAQLNVVSNLELDWRYQVDQTMVDPNWLTIKSVEEISQGHYLVTYDAKSLLDRNTISRRESTLSFSNEKSFMGKFVTFRQGYTEEYAQDFSSLTEGYVELTGKQTYTTETLHVINKDYYNYVTFNAYAYKADEFSYKNVTLTVTVDGGPIFKDINRKVYTVNVPKGTEPKASNMNFLLMWNKGDVMGSKTTLTFSVNNEEGDVVYIDNLHIYKVSEAELDNFADDEYEDEMEDWE